MFKNLLDKIRALERCGQKRVQKETDNILSEILNSKLSKKEAWLLEARLLHLYFERVHKYDPFPNHK